MKLDEKDIIPTNDGSVSIIHPILGELYHSDRGAISESQYVYIDKGFSQIDSPFIKILEFGFGSGLNFLLTLQESINKNIRVEYHTFELYPLDFESVQKLNFSQFCSQELYSLFLKAHKGDFNTKIKLTQNFDIIKYPISFTEYQNFPTDLNLVYFDAFSPEIQPELWSLEIFSAIYNNLCTAGRLVTYSAKGFVKQNLRDAGFVVKREKGALGKHHMLVATKNE